MNNIKVLNFQVFNICVSKWWNGFCLFVSPHTRPKSLVTDVSKLLSVQLHFCFCARLSLLSFSLLSTDVRRSNQMCFTFPSDMTASLFCTIPLKALKLIRNRTHSPSALMQTWLTHPLWQCMPKVSWSHLILISANCYLLFLQMQSSYRGFYVPVDIEITYHTLTQWDPSVSALSSAQLCQPVYPPHSARQSHASQVLPSKSAVRSGLFIFLSG